MKTVQENLQILQNIGSDPKAKAAWVSGDADKEFIVKDDGSYCLVTRGEEVASAIARIACPGFSFTDRLRISFLDQTIILG